MAGPLGGFLRGQDAGVAANLARQKRSDEQYASAFDRLIKVGNAGRADTAEARQGTADLVAARNKIFEAAGSVTPGTIKPFLDQVDLAARDYPNLGVDRGYFENLFGVRSQPPAAPPPILGSAEPAPGQIGPPPPPDIPRPVGTPEAAGAAPPPPQPAGEFRFQSPATEAAYYRGLPDARSAKLEAEHGAEFMRIAQQALGPVLTDPRGFATALLELRAQAAEYGYSDKWVDDQLSEITTAAVQAQDRAWAEAGRSKEREEDKRMAVKDLEGFLGRALGKSDGMGNFSFGESERGLYLFLMEKGTTAVQSGSSAAQAFRYLARTYGNVPDFTVRELTPYARGILNAPEDFVAWAAQAPPGSDASWDPEKGRGGIILPNGSAIGYEPPRLQGGLPPPPEQIGPTPAPAAPTAPSTIRLGPFGADSTGLPPPQRKMFGPSGGA